MTRIGVLGTMGSAQEDGGWLNDDIIFASTSPDLILDRVGNVITIGLISSTKLEYKKTHPDAITPYKSRSTDTGYDLATIKGAIIPPHSMVNFPTGLIVAAPPGYYYTIDGRSSLWSKGIVPARGIIDAAYVGDLMIALLNISDWPYEVEAGNRIAQLVLHKTYEADFVEVESFSPEYSTRGTNGFGSSGA